MKIKLIIAAIITGLFLVGCGPSWEDDKYRIYFRDGICLLGLKIDENGGLYEGVIHNVIAVGSNNKYVVIKKQISENDIIEYFYLDKERSRVGLSMSEIVEGPFTEIEFMQLKASLSLPEFQW